MEIFKALMQVFVGVAGLNIILSFVLWRTTKYRPCLYMLSYWILILVDFFVQGAVAEQPPFNRILAFAPYQFFFHYSLALTLASLLDIPLPFKKVWYFPLISLVSLFILNGLNVPPEWLPVPHILIHSCLYFYVVYQAIRYHRPQLTPSLWALCVLYILWGLHLFDYAYFYVRFDLFIVGFTVALMLLIAFAILVPGAIIERISLDKARLETEMQYKASLIQASKMGALGEMAGGVAHELNNPLAVLLITLESMVDEVVGLKDDSGFTAKLNRCISTVDRMSHIVKSLLIFSQEDRSGGRRRILVEDLIHHTTPLFAEKLANRKIDFSVQVPHSPIVVNVHPAQISQVILSLISNSIDALNELEKKWIRLVVQELSNQVEFCIQDSGPGPRQQDLDRIFQPFFSAKDFRRGMGLGLSISQGIIEAHGGSIFFDRRNGTASFVFRLPKVQASSDRSV